MVYIQKLPYTGTNLIVKGQAYHFDILNTYKKVVQFKYINVEEVQILSCITQGNVVEVANTNDLGDVIKRTTITVADFLTELKRLEANVKHIVTLIKPLNINGISSKQYIVVYRK
ncbi:hypothetical protein COF68_05665 [Bacillus toyonensis]|uniref:hypothetical protein n=1 Tax=Bacillus toyonensis TaxID=155322 RepID=UPI000BFC88B1|nr:hypothetical protein [Bacillus toyonensis]PHE64329.1 hypothetical protein COF68_05665 [Bacillus toyonensis]